MIKSAGAIYTNIDTYRHPVDGTRVDVVGMCHVADEPFYNRIQSFLDDRTMDGVNVQYEGVTGLKPGEHVPKSTARKVNLLVESVAGLGNMFEGTGLIGQNEALVCRPSWMNCDMTITEVVADLDLQKLIAMAAVTKATARMMSRMSPRQRRTTLIEGLQENISRTKSGATGWMGSLAMDGVIIDRRNDVALAGVDRQRQRRPDTDFALVWGQAHLPGLGVGLSRRGYHLEKQVRVPAIHP